MSSYCAECGKEADGRFCSADCRKVVQARNARELGHRAREELLRKIETAKDIISDNCSLNGGIYSDGELTLATVCRLAGISTDVLHHRNHRDTTKIEVKAFIDKVNAALVKSAPVGPRGGTPRSAEIAKIQALEAENQRLAEHLDEAVIRAETAMAQAKKQIAAEMERLKLRVAELESRMENVSLPDNVALLPGKRD